MMDVWPSISLERASSISRARVSPAYLFPLPPLAEQHRIVAKVDELMAVFDRIVASLASGNDTRRHLLNALLHEALSLSEEKIWKDISTIAQRTAGRTTRIARSVDRANIGRDII